MSVAQSLSAGYSATSGTCEAKNPKSAASSPAVTGSVADLRTPLPYPSVNIPTGSSRAGASDSFGPLGLPTPKRFLAFDLEPSRTIPRSRRGVRPSSADAEGIMLGGRSLVLVRRGCAMIFVDVSFLPSRFFMQISSLYRSLAVQARAAVPS